MHALVAAVSSIGLFAAFTEAAPPEACFTNFRSEDCGGAPEPVMYYWKPGSRCEVGIWRGCLPSLNMFKDEYECVSTCIFTVRAQPSDFHQGLGFEEYDSTTVPTTIDSSENDTSTATTDTGNSTGTGEGDESVTDGGGSTADGDATAGDGTTKAGDSPAADASAAGGEGDATAAAEGGDAGDAEAAPEAEETPAPDAE